MDRSGLIWQRPINGPFITAQKGTAAPDAVTTPDVLFVEGSPVFYVGAVDKESERIIRMPVSGDDFINPQTLGVKQDAKVILTAGPLDFDCRHVFDPATLRWQDRFFLYYSAIGKGVDSIGLATSDDGVHFVKQEGALFLGRSPEVIVKDGVVHIFFVKERTNEGYSIYSAQSDDGFQFDISNNEPVLTIGTTNEWDDQEVTTPRIIEVDGSYYMVYAGIGRDDFKDVPRAFGLARSNDLVHWRKYPGNPVFRCGPDGSWDDGGIWFGTPLLLHEHLYLVYEGGRRENILETTPALTQVGLAMLPLRAFLEAMSCWE